jgi:putative protein kinase ArgK-like GTPase of G3E family
MKEDESNKIIIDAAKSIADVYTGNKNDYRYERFNSVYNKMLRVLSSDDKFTLINGQPEESAKIYTNFLLKNNGISELNKPLGFLINKINSRKDESGNSVADKVDKMLPEVMLERMKKREEREREERAKLDELEAPPEFYIAMGLKKEKDNLENKNNKRHGSIFKNKK